MQVVLVLGPLHRLAGVAARVPDEQVPLARGQGHLDLAVAVEVADSGCHHRPAAGELGPAHRRHAAEAVGAEVVHGRRLQHLGSPVTVDVGDGRGVEELEVVHLGGEARVEGPRLCIPRVDVVLGAQLLLGQDHVEQAPEAGGAHGHRHR